MCYTTLLSTTADAFPELDYTDKYGMLGNGVRRNKQVKLRISNTEHTGVPRTPTYDIMINQKGAKERQATIYYPHSLATLNTRCPLLYP